MSQVEEFLTAAEEQEIVHTIGLAEKNTSGEIRVHIENHTDLKPLERAQEVFHQLRMDETELRNGVLFYVGVSDHSFAILGDKGINDLVEPDFWECTKDIVIENFKNKQFKDGLVKGIIRAGERLKQYFPFAEGDTNELSNELSKG